MNEQAKPHAGSRADALRGLAHVFVRALEVEAVVGVHDHEKVAPQPLRISIDLTVREAPEGHDDKIASVVCYEDVVRGVQSICGTCSSRQSHPSTIFQIACRASLVAYRAVTNWLSLVVETISSPRGCSKRIG